MLGQAALNAPNTDIKGHLGNLEIFSFIFFSQIKLM